MAAKRNIQPPANVGQLRRSDSSLRAGDLHGARERRVVGSDERCTGRCWPGSSVPANRSTSSRKIRSSTFPMAASSCAISETVGATWSSTHARTHVNPGNPVTVWFRRAIRTFWYGRTGQVRIVVGFSRPGASWLSGLGTAAGVA